MSADVIDLAAEREKRRNAATGKVAIVIGILLGAWWWWRENSRGAGG